MIIDESEIVLSIVMILNYFAIMMRLNIRQVISLKEFTQQTKKKTIQELTFLLLKMTIHFIGNEIPDAYYALCIFKSFSSYCRHPTGHFSN